MKNISFISNDFTCYINYKWSNGDIGNTNKEANCTSDGNQLTASWIIDDGTSCVGKAILHIFVVLEVT